MYVLRMYVVGGSAGVSRLSRLDRLVSLEASTKTKIIITLGRRSRTRLVCNWTILDSLKRAFLDDPQLTQQSFLALRLSCTTANNSMGTLKTQMTGGADRLQVERAMANGQPAKSTLLL